MIFVNNLPVIIIYKKHNQQTIQFAKFQWPILTRYQVNVNIEISTIDSFVYLFVLSELNMNKEKRLRSEFRIVYMQLTH